MPVIVADVALREPFTSNLVPGYSLPIPTLPLAAIFNLTSGQMLSPIVSPVSAKKSIAPSDLKAIPEAEVPRASYRNEPALALLYI